ncbi:MAG: hypothetical protein ACI978_001432 [Oleispira sp.]|jgi:hypothetical protein
MDSAFETRTLALTFDLITDKVPPRVGKAADILWKDVLISQKFHSEVTQRILNSLKKEYGLISKEFYNSNKKEIHSIISKSAGQFAENSYAGVEIKDLGSELEGSLKEIESHFNHSKAGIWIDEAGKSVTIITSVIMVGAYGIYSFRNAKLMQNVVNTASLLGLANKSFHIGGIKINGAISDYSVSKSTAKLNVTAAGQWKSIQLKAKSNGIVNFNTGQIMDASASVDVSYQINDRVLLGGGISSSFIPKTERKIENSVYFKAKITSGAHSLLLSCSVTDKSNSPTNKECSASASIKF